MGCNTKNEGEDRDNWLVVQRYVVFVVFKSDCDAGPTEEMVLIPFQVLDF